jgi:glycine oxidase
MDQQPIWFEGIEPAELEPVDALPARADVAIVGGGIVGLAVAHALAARGVPGVVVLERGRLLSEASGANAGGIWPNQQSPVTGGIFKRLGDASVALMEAMARDEGMRFAFGRHGLMVVARTEADLAERAAEFEQRRAAGLTVELLDAATAREMEPALSPEVRGALWFPRDAQVHPVRLGLELLRAARLQGVRVLTGTPVGRLVASGGRVERVETPAGSVAVGSVVAAAGPWVPALAEAAGLEIPIVPVRGQLVATEPLPPLLRASVIDRWGGTRQIVGGRVVAGGTVEHAGFDTDPTAANFDKIYAGMGETFPALAGCRVTHTWARLRPGTPDGLPILGPVPGWENVLVAAGHYRNGVLLGPITGKLIAEWIVDGAPSLPLDELSIARFDRVV